MHICNVHAKGIVELNIKRKSDLDFNHRPQKHELVQDIYTLNICVKLYENQSTDEGARTMTKCFFLKQQL